MKPLLQWLWFALAVVMCINVAFWFQYEPLSLRGTFELIYVWDRWHNRVCMVGLASQQRILCSPDELDVFGRPKRQ